MWCTRLELLRDDEGYALVCEWLDCATLANLCRCYGPLPISAALHVGAGDTLYLTEAPDGFRITPYDPAFQLFAHGIPPSQLNLRSEKRRDLTTGKKALQTYPPHLY
jgi:hypothetical protein